VLVLIFVMISRDFGKENSVVLVTSGKVSLTSH